MYAYDAYILGEKAQRKPPGDVDSWNQLWLDIINSLNEDPEQNKKYINYIHEHRAAEGLPPLKWETGL
jgi:uncharacterized protein YkwD